MYMWFCEGKLKVKIANLRLPSRVSKTFVLKIPNIMCLAIPQLKLEQTAKKYLLDASKYDLSTCEPKLNFLLS